MEQIIYLLQFIFWTLLTGIVLIILYFVWSYFKDKRKERDLDFDIRYLKIECILGSYPVTEKTMNRLLKDFCDLRKLKHPNKEKVEVLWNQYSEKYHELSREILSEDEHSVSQIFAGE